MSDSDPDPEEARLVARLRCGDREALDPLLDRYRPYLRRIVDSRLDRRLRTRLGVSDVVQAAEVGAFEGIAEFLEGEPIPFRWWMRKAVHAELRRVYRAHVLAGKRAIEREVPLPDRSSLILASRFAAGGPSPSQDASRREMAQRVRGALAELEEKDREILLMRTFEDLPYDEIGYVLKIDPAAARMRQGRALVRLGKALGAKEGGRG